MRSELPFPTARAIARDLSRDAEAICRRLLSRGRREGRHWRVGDLANTHGRSLTVALAGSKAGRWIDHATGEHGDLLDLIALRETGGSLSAAMQLARHRFGGGPFPETSAPSAASACGSDLPDTVALARRLWARCGPLPGTLAEAYLHNRALPGPFDGLPLRFHPALPFRPRPDTPFEHHLALVAAVTDDAGRLMAVQRTWLDPEGGKAEVRDARRSLGRVGGYAVRFPAFGNNDRADRLVVGEGVETVLSLRDILPGWPLAACLSAGALAAFAPSPNIRRLIIAHDSGAAGLRAAHRLAERMRAEGREVTLFRPVLSDANADRQQIGVGFVCERVAAMLGHVQEAGVFGSRPSGSTASSVGAPSRFQAQSATQVPPGDITEG